MSLFLCFLSCVFDFLSTSLLRRKPHFIHGFFVLVAIDLMISCSLSGYHPINCLLGLIALALLLLVVFVYIFLCLIVLVFGSFVIFETPKYPNYLGGGCVW